MFLWKTKKKKIEQMTVFVNSQFLAQQSPAVGIDAFEVFDGGFQEVLLHSLDTDDADLIRKDTDKNGFLIWWSEDSFLFGNLKFEVVDFFLTINLLLK